MAFISMSFSLSKLEDMTITGSLTAWISTNAATWHYEKFRSLNFTAYGCLRESAYMYACVHMYIRALRRQNIKIDDSFAKNISWQVPSVEANLGKRSFFSFSQMLPTFSIRSISALGVFMSTNIQKETNFALELFVTRHLEIIYQGGGHGISDIWIIYIPF
ncbi:hypothetical protein PAAG_12066 [Paracoccidioides lutzii Pb01]|uniref:Uncharacterized protein n=1 Tax=Paracoccidioides lutzii (strain ATCC MYA-826 / Pb01) TaxID=502779 RepID=A0A0A2V162_PARBA|nr:hypothetical protein PAAG_12066 [Paracoccidioides lutzii Pb01]KGQ01208.1 hypothetical protein PAAG_12066 [Paracoccidioides lutzii Pb01]